MTNKHELNHRDFIKATTAFVGGLIGITIGLPSIAYLLSPSLCKTGPLDKYPDVRIFSDICTHLACRVSWHFDQQHYVSPCHDGHFDVDGKTLAARCRAHWMNL